MDIGHLSKDFSSSIDEHAIKVRKPYTITKQRERWTEEEHEKFLEALKLYGRAWRQIEEHIGSKTAVQIRSHAQKFFSKVVREPGTAKAIEIPPPRPKRKPLHPYPRKLGNSPTKRLPVMEKSAWTSLAIPSVFEPENSSPVSVLYASGSDTVGSTVSSPQNCCASSVSSAARSDPVGALITEQENGCRSPTTSVEDENRSVSPGPASTYLLAEDKSQMEVDLNTKDGSHSRAGPQIEAQAISLKLFGRTVFVTDAQNPSSGKRMQSLDSSNHNVNANMDLQAPTKPALQSTIQDDFWGGPGKSAWSPWNGGTSPMFHCLPPHMDLTKSAEAASPLPWWWAHSGALPAFPFINPQGMSSIQSQPQTRTAASDDKDNRTQCSWTGCNTGYAGRADGDKNSVAVDDSQQVAEPNENSAFGSLKLCSDKSPRGFIPYERCLAEKQAQQRAHMVNEERDGQAVGLCLQPFFTFP